MNPSRYLNKLTAVQKDRRTTLGLMLRPHLLEMPLAIQRHDDPFLPFSKAVINVTRDLVCAYVFDLASYLAIGAAGAVALERSIAYARADMQTVTILHAPFATGDFATATGDTALAVDAVTLTPDADPSPYLTIELGVYVASQAARAAGGWFDPVVGHMQIENIGGALKIDLIPSQVVNAHRREDFEEALRQAVQTFDR
ncbi:MAG: hypothetical protein IPK19_32930 [Chloroflexi bacterium]|nr:hypothetical protein [Chloroflexota bacterium]